MITLETKKRGNGLCLSKQVFISSKAGGSAYEEKNDCSINDGGYVIGTFADKCGTGGNLPEG